MRRGLSGVLFGALLLFPAAPASADLALGPASPPIVVKETPPSGPAPVGAASKIPTPTEEAALIATAKAEGGFYQGCDGYGRPTLSGDGMTKWGLVLGIFVGGGDTTRSTPQLGKLYNIGACGAALDELRSKFPQYWMRRVSIVRARAIHRLAMGDTAGALSDLDAAEAEAGPNKDDVFYRRSLALGVELLRAYAVRQSGDPAKAETLTLQAWATRPWNRETARAALLVLGPGASESALRRVLSADAQFNPSATGTLFDFEFERGHFDRALDLFDGLTPPVILSQGANEARDVAMLEQQNRTLAAFFWAVEDGRHAYALAALGRRDQARAALKASADRLAASTPPAQALAPDASTRDKMLNAVWEQGNLMIQTRVPPAIEGWRKLVQARLDLGEGKTESAAALLKDAKVPQSYAGIDLMDAWGALDASRKPVAAMMHQAAINARKSSPAADITGLFETLPEAETKGRLAGNHNSHKLLGSINGFSVIAHPDRNMTTVGYRGVWSSMTIMEEEALRKAADVAREQGKAGFVVLARRDIRHTTTLYQYGRAIRTDPTGYETQLDVIFVDPANPPAPFDKARWRIIDATAVHDALAPVYLDAGEGGAQ